jgi:hypothetical protein
VCDKFKQQLGLLKAALFFFDLLKPYARGSASEISHAL